jgi:hypothetical protein
VADARDDGTQLVCSSEPRCLCARKKYSCTCTPGGFDDRKCTRCEAELVRINVDTAEEVIRG